MPSFMENKNIDAMRIQCENASSPSEKRIMCRDYEMAKGQTPAERQAFADGGDVGAPAFVGGDSFEGEMGDMMEESEPSILDLAQDVLDEEDLAELNDILDMHPNLPRIIDQLSMAEDGMEGPIEGPGDETSDSIPAKLSDGEFVFTAKAVKQLGVDKLMKMMKKAEQDFDAAHGEPQEEFACGGFVRRK